MLSIFERLSISDSISLEDISLFRWSIFLRGFWQIRSSKELVRLISVTKLEGIELCTDFLYDPFDVRAVCGDVPYFISDVSNLSPLFFLSLARGLLTLLISSKNQFLVLLIFFINLLF